MSARVPMKFLTVLLPAVILATAMVGTQGTAAQAVSADEFDPGMIITDADFYDSDAMTANEVQTFLDEKVPTCHPEWDSDPDDITCLKDFTETMLARDAVTTSNGTVLCKAISSKQRTAAQIIDTVARACGISQQVLLVMLQKETGLVTHQWPSSWRYDRAMGYACPDTAPCDTKYYGFSNQVYNAALQFKRYQQYPSSYGYEAFQNNYIQWHPNSSCGGSWVYIKNQATAGLYIYTPYQPNQAALNAGYGTGDSCSSYGNRNFFLYYSNWFGISGKTPAEMLAIEYEDRGGSATLGAPVAAMVTTSSGAYREYESGYLFVTASGAATFLGTDWKVTIQYCERGGPNGSWGWPTGDRFATSNGSASGYGYDFEYATAYGFGGAPLLVEGTIFQHWQDHGGADSAGIPKANAVVLDGGRYQRFTSGDVFVTAAGESSFLGADWKVTLDYWAVGGPSGAWGFSTNDRYRTSGGYGYSFQNAMAYGFGGDPLVVDGAIFTHWNEHGGESAVGVPTGAAIDTAQGTYQRFVYGDVFTNGLGDAAFLGYDWKVTLDYWDQGGPSGPWGLAVSDRYRAGSGWAYSFTNATAFGLGGTPRVIVGDVYEEWVTRGAESGVGLPIAAAATETDSGAAQLFELGYLFVTDAGTSAFLGGDWKVTSVYESTGGLTGPWGLATADRSPVAGGWTYPFERAAAFGLGGAPRVVEGELYDAWIEQGSVSGIGVPSANATSTSGVTSQRFAEGLIALVDGRAIVVDGELYEAWLAKGALATIGTPLADAVAVDGGAYQQFPSGYLFVTDGGATTFLGTDWKVTVTYWENGGADGSWGLPNGDRYRVGSGWAYPFEQATVFGLGGAPRVVEGAIWTEWVALGGVDTLGLPAAAATVGSGGVYQEFASGFVFASDSSEPAYLGSDWGITLAYWNRGGPAGVWGWPTGERYWLSNHYVYPFENVLVHGYGSRLEVEAR